MKTQKSTRIIFVLIVLVITTTMWAQTPQKFSYQAVVKNASNNLVTNHAVGLKLSILNASSTVVYAETQTPVTNANGLISVEVGSGTVETGTMAGIDWSTSTYSLKSEIDPTGGTSYSITGTSSLLSVPYALHAKTVDNAFSGSYTDLTNKPTLATVAISGSYADLTNKPSIPSGTVTSVTGTSPISVATGTSTPAISLGTVPVANGGTGTTTAPTQYGVIYASSTSAYASTTAGTSGYLLQSNGTSAPSWLSTVPVGNGGTGATTLTGVLKGNGTSAITVMTGTTGYNTYWSDANTLAAEQYLATSRGGLGASMTAGAAYAIPYATSTTAYGTLAGNTSSTKKFLTQTGTGAVSAAPAWGTIASTDISGTMAVANGGTGATTLTGYVKGTGTTAMTASATIPAADISGNITGNAANVTGTVAVGNGGTGATTLTGYVKGTGTTAMTASATIPAADISGNITGNAANVTGTVAVGNGGTGATTLTGYVKGSGTTVMTASATIPAADISGNITGNAANVTGTVAAANGGTGQTSYAVGDLLYASTTSALSKLADVATGNALISGGVGVAPAWGKIALTTHVSGTLPVANGGTGATTLTGYVKGTGTTAMTASATIPAADISGNITGNAANVTGTVALANGGTGATTAATARTSLGAAASGANSDITSLTGLTTDITVAQGGTGTSSATVQGGVVYGTSTTAMASTAAGTSGQVLTSNGSSAPTWTTIATPPGVIQQYAGSSAPTGYLLCQGQAISRTTYAALYAIIGTTYGTGDGSTTFNLPNLQGRVPVGKRTTVGTFDALNEMGGEETHTLTAAEMAAHAHTIPALSGTAASAGAHTHTLTAPATNIWANYRGTTQNGLSTDTNLYTSSSDGTHTHSVTTTASTTGSNGSGTAFNVVQPYIVLNYIIKI